MAPKVVVITGCSSGIGMATALHLAGDKDNRFKVFATMRNLAKKDQLEAAASQLLDKSLFICQLDVTKEDSIQAFMEKINREEGGVDVLINYAGMGQAGVLEKMSMDQIKTVYETNVFGLIRMTQAVIPGMKAKKSGHIINVSSAAGLIGVPFFDIYVSSKFAVEGFSESLAPVLKKFNISVSVMEPGPVYTKFGPNMTANNTGAFGVGDTFPEDPGMDELTTKLKTASFDETMRCFLAAKQSVEEVAEWIKGAILSDKPHLHYVTSEYYKKLLEDTKFIDVTGDTVFESISQSQNWDD